jgi:hypothetical protein
MKITKKIKAILLVGAMLLGLAGLALEANLVKAEYIDPPGGIVVPFTLR